MQSSNSPDYQSMRSSCNRCRSKKIGCVLQPQSTSSRHPQCARCVRAKVDCVFGRRARATKSVSSVAIRKPTTENQEMLHGDINTDISISTTLEPCISLSPTLDTSSPSSTSQAWYTNLLSDVQTQNFSDLLNTSTLETDVLSIDTSMTNDLSKPPVQGRPFGHHPAKCSSSVTSTAGSAHEFQVLPDSTPSRIVGELSEIVAEIHRTAARLDLSRALCSATLLDTDNCSISAVWKLGQKCAAALRRVGDSVTWQNVSCSDQPCLNEWAPKPKDSSDKFQLLYGVEDPNWPSVELMDFLSGPEGITCSPHAVSVLVDTPTTLLVLGCYTSLIKLYVSSVDHIKLRVDAVPDTFSQQGSDCEEQLCGPGTASDAYSRQHMAIQMLLDGIQVLVDSVDFSEATLHPKRSTMVEGFEQGSTVKATIGRNTRTRPLYPAELVRVVINEDTDDEIQYVLRQGQSLKESLYEKMRL
jgi:hypothetical protein